MKIHFAGLIIVIAFCAACTTKIPEIVKYEPPVITDPDMSTFIDDGCQADYYGYLTCPAKSPPAALECTYLRTPDTLLGGLNPAYPIAKCQLGYDKNPSDTGNFIYEEGCLDHRWVQWVIFRGGQYQYLVNISDLQSVYVPIDSREEALSYAVAATGLQAWFDIETPPEYRYEVDQIEETWVEETDQGFRVHLFEYSTCGCGPHMVQSITVNVSHDGQISQEPAVDLFRDPRLDDVCGD